MRATKSTLAQFTALAQEKYPQEACGLVIAVGRKQVLIPCDNVHEDPGNHFTITSQQWAAAEDQGDVIMVLHSHPGDGCRPVPCDLDRQQCSLSGVTWGILALPSGEYDETEPENGSLLGRPFILGSWDCYGLIIDWHRLQGVELKDRRVTYPWWESQYPDNLYSDFWEEDGFIECDPVPGAMVIMQISADKWNHAGIITEDDQLLHHLYGQPSCITPYQRGYFRDRTVMVVRHKNLPKEIKPWR